MLNQVGRALLRNQVVATRIRREGVSRTQSKRIERFGIRREISQDQKLSDSRAKRPHSKRNQSPLIFIPPPSMHTTSVLPNPTEQAATIDLKSTATLHKATESLNLWQKLFPTGALKGSLPPRKIGRAS